MYGKYFPKRYTVAAFTFLGFMILFYLRANLSIALVEMTSNRTITEGNVTYHREPEFKWNSQVKGFILSSFSYGYFLAPLGGVMAVKYGGATIFGLGILITAFLTVLSPVFLRFHYYIFILARTLEGIFESFSMAASAEIYARWAPPKERARFIVLSHSGVYFGTAINYPISGFIAKLFGWEAIFYFSGGLAVVWYVLWISTVSNDPTEDKRISEAEKSYLQENIIHVEQEKITYPWKKIFLSKPTLAFFFHKFANSWAFAFILFCLPLYIKGLHDVEIEDIGILSSIPNFCTIISQPIAAFTFDYVRKKKYLSITTIHKLFTCGSYFLGAILFIVVGSWTNFLGSMICFSAFRFVASYGETSYNILPVDLSPRFASVLAGAGSSFYSVGSLLSPIVLGYIVFDLHDTTLWKYYFQVLSAVFTAGGLVFLLFGSGEQQSWNDAIMAGENHPTKNGSENQQEKGTSSTISNS